MPAPIPDHAPAEDAIARSIASGTVEAIQFPPDLGGFGISLSFQEYSYDAVEARGLLGIGGGGESRAATIGSIMLPLPLALSDSHGISIQGTEMGALGAAALDLARIRGIRDAGQLFYDSGAGAGNLVKEFTVQNAGAAAGEAAGAAQYFLRSTVESLFAGAGSALSIANGTAVNPHLALTFEGVSLKEYSFSWRLAPANPRESDLIRRIVAMLRRHALPAYKSVAGGGSASLSRGLLKYPSLVNPVFVGIDAAHYWFFKPCMIAGITTNFSPEGVAVQAGGRPAMVDLELQLKETSIHTRDDY